jgi:hypothetical protein
LNEFTNLHAAPDFLPAAAAAKLDALKEDTTDALDQAMIATI